MQALVRVSEIAPIWRIVPVREIAPHYRNALAWEIAQRYRNAPGLPTLAPNPQIVRTSAAAPAWAVNLAEAAVLHRVT